MLKNNQINTFYDTIFDEISVMDVDKFDYPLNKFSNDHFLSLATLVFEQITDRLKLLPSWVLMGGMAKLSSIVSNENYTLGEILSLETVSEEKKLFWLDTNEQFLTLLLEDAQDGFTTEACRIYWDNLNMYGDLVSYSQGEGTFKQRLRSVLKTMLT